jgi:type II secretory pathway pseudopilin PulG
MKKYRPTIIGFIIVIVAGFFAASTVRHLWTQRQERIATEKQQQEEYARQKIEEQRQESLKKRAEEEARKVAELKKKKVGERADDLVEEWFIVMNSSDHSYSTDVADPWGNALKFEENDDGHVVSSSGADGKWGTDDDIVYVPEPEKKGVLQKLKGLKFW